MMLPTMTLSFIEYLENNLRENPPKQRGVRTRERLKIAASKALEEKGYHALRVADDSDFIDSHYRTKK